MSPPETSPIQVKMNVGDGTMKLCLLWFCLPLALAAADEPQLSARKIVNAAGGSGGRVAPGEILVLFPSNVGPPGLAGGQIDSSGRVTTSLGETRVFFDGIPAPMAYSVQGDVEAVVPYEVASRKTTEIVVEYQGSRSAPVRLPVVPSAPALFTLDSSGRGQAAMLNETGCCNSARNPATRGHVAVAYATGEGQTVPPGITGSVSAHTRIADYPAPRLPVRITVGGKPAQILYAAEAPHAVAGLLQVNFRIPANAPLGEAVPIVLQVGNARSPDGVTIAIRSPVQRILIVDNDLPARDWLQSILRRAGFQVVSASTGPEGLAQAGSTVIDLIIFNLAISAREGLEAIGSLRAAQPQLKIMAIAGSLSPAALRAADLLEAQAVLNKSMTSEMVLRRVRAVLRPRPVPYVADSKATVPH